ncbi:MAG: hypothetical protein K2N87_01070 [Eubacterium sp.]|nr:hypothetical protein [Eubacterium sp.]
MQQTKQQRMDDSQNASQQPVNIEKIMEEIRAEIMEKGYTADMLSFADVPLPAAEDEPDSAAAGEAVSQAVSRMQGLSFIAWRRPVNAGIKGIVKRILYKLSGFIAAPMSEDQTAFNGATVSAMEQLFAVLKAQQQEIEQQKASIERLQKHLSNLEKKSAQRRRNG